MMEFLFLKFERRTSKPVFKYLTSLLNVDEFIDTSIINMV